ncbi:ATP-binding protein [Devosia sp. A8/3-2]|nr:ATP-binding protein [Devosia sp. A8/3-2]
MVGNIVENAIRFTPARGRITLAAFAATDGVVIEITDTGIGMDEERLASLSQPFALGDATFTRDGVGPGLGISIARAIAELSGGGWRSIPARRWARQLRFRCQSRWRGIRWKWRLRVT